MTFRLNPSTTPEDNAPLARNQFRSNSSWARNVRATSFNGSMRDEVLNGEEFDSLLEARVVVSDWVDRYNRERPHRGLGMKTPLQYAEEWNARNESSK